MPRKSASKDSPNVTMVRTSDLKPYDKNPRIIGEDAVEQVANSIRQFGFRDPIEVLPDMTILCGHTRRLAALKLGLEQVPVIIHDMDAEHADMYRLANNKVGEAAGWDFPTLDAELDRLDGLFDREDFGFLRYDDEGEIVEEENEEKPDVPVLEGDGESGGDYVVIVECSNKVAQDAAYRRLTDEGFVCRKV